MIMKVRISNNTYKNILALIGITYISYYMWFRFLRLRLPKDIPFELTILGCICLFFICTTYLYILYRYFKPKLPSPFLFQILGHVSKILTPLYVLDNLVQQNKSYKKIFIRFLYFIVKTVTNQTIVSYLINGMYPPNELIFYMKYIMFPKIFILIILIIDIFYFHKLDYFYVSIILGVNTLFLRYIRYSVEKTLEEITVYLETNFVVYIIPQEEEIEDNYPFDRESLSNDDYFGYSEEILHGDYDKELTFANVRNFINAQSAAISFNDTQYQYTCLEKFEARKEYCTKYNIQDPYNEVGSCFEGIPGHDQISRELAKEFHKYMPMAVNFTVFVEHTNRHNTKKIIKLNMWIIMGYLLCWSYILIVSIRTLNIQDILNLLENTYKYEKPF